VNESGKVLVVGLGMSGVAACRLADRLGMTVCATDDHELMADTAASLPARVDVVAREHAEKLIGDVATVITSPGVAATHPLLAAALERGKPVLSEMEFAAGYVEAPLLAVTGTNGKSTTVTVLGRMLEAAGRRVFVGGNIGNPLSNAVGGHFDVCCLEVSSFQLEWVDRFAPEVAAVLNVSPDHLDRHGSMSAYVRAKLRIFAAMAGREGGHAVLGDGQAWWRVHAADIAVPVSRFAAGDAATSTAEMTFDLRTRILCGPGHWRAAVAGRWPAAPHDFENLAAAAEMARLTGVEPAEVERAVADFEGLHHRLQLVGVRGGVEFWNDSKATNTGAALRSLEAFSQPVILMAGGLGKGEDYGVLAGPTGLKRVVAYGAAGPAIAAAIGDRVPVTEAGRFVEGFEAAVAAAEPGDVVLLAPACASFDEFSSYAARGERFEALVEGLGQ
jgi:UDP-N-acetylmuramoylalanine--D-glutamate ligase